MNYVLLVGRIVNDINVEEEGNNKIAKMVLAVNRSYKNEEGIYDTDFIDILLSDNGEYTNGLLATNTAEYCRKGDILGVKGRLETENYIDAIYGEKKKRYIVKAEKVTFLSSKHVEVEEI